MKIEKLTKKLSADDFKAYVVEGRSRIDAAETKKSESQEFVNLMMQTSEGKRVIGAVAEQYRIEHNKYRDGLSDKDRKKTSRQHPKVAILRVQVQRTAKDNSQTVPTIRLGKNGKMSVTTIPRNTRSRAPMTAKGKIDAGIQLFLSSKPNKQSRMELTEYVMDKLGCSGYYRTNSLTQAA